MMREARGLKIKDLVKLFVIEDCSISFLNSEYFNSGNIALLILKKKKTPTPLRHKVGDESPIYFESIG